MFVASYWRARFNEASGASACNSRTYIPVETGATNNTSNFTSILPVVVLDDHGDGQPTDSGSNTYTPTMMHVFMPQGGTTRLVDAASGEGIPEVFTRAGTRIRGSSSAGFPKKSYGLETWDEANIDLDVAFPGLPADSDWILNGPYQYDDTFIHNSYIFEISRRIGRWCRARHG